MTAVTLLSPSAGEEIRSTHIQQFVNLLSSGSGGGVGVFLTDFSSSTSYSLIVGNQDTTNGYALRVQYGPKATPTILAEFRKSSSYIQSPDTANVLDVSNSGISITGTLTVNGNVLGGGVSVFNVLDYGIETSTDATEAGGSSVRANNTSLMHNTLMPALRAAGGGDIEFPPHAANVFYPFTNLTFSHTTGAPISIGLRGHGYSSLVKVWGTSGYLLDFAGTSGSPWWNSFVRDLTVYPAQKMSSGAAFRIKTVNEFELRNVRLHVNATTNGAQSAAELGAATATGTGLISNAIRITDCKLSTLTDSTAAAVTVYPMSGLYITRTDISGYNGGTTGLRFLPQGTTTAGASYNIIDTVVIQAALVKDHKVGMRMGEQGKLSNVQILGGHLDGIGAKGSTTSTALNITTAAGATVENVQVKQGWSAVYNSTGTGYGYLIDATAGGTINNVNIEGSYFTGENGPRSAAILINGPVTNANVLNNTVNGSTDVNNNEIDVEGGTGVVLIGNRAIGPGNSGYAILAATSVRNLVCVGNLGTGKATGGTPTVSSTADRIFSANI